jgi:hypothetical protein
MIPSRSILLISLAVYFVGLVYFLSPAPSRLSLPEAVISNEAGDTWQHPDQSGYYTNLSRPSVIGHIINQFQLQVFGYKLSGYRLNYRPEEAGTLVRDQLKSNYLEEIVFPMHSSIFVNGWEPKLAPKRGKSGTPDDNLSINGVPYQSKVTLRPINSTASARVLVWTLIFPLSHLVYLSLKYSRQQ